MISIFDNDLSSTAYLLELAAKAVSNITKVRRQMRKRFILADHVELKCDLGVEMSKIGIKQLMIHLISSDRVCKKILERFKMAVCKTVKPPFCED